jgi:hypothetical protein
MRSRVFSCCFNRKNYLLLTYSVVGIATGYWLGDRGVGVRVPIGSRIFFSPHRSDRLWSPLNLLSNGYRDSFPGDKAVGA